MAEFQFGASSLRNMEGVHPFLIRVAEKALKISMIDFGVPKFGGVRTAAERKKLFDAWRTKCDGYERISAHQEKRGGYGNALDVFAYVNGEASWDRIHLAMVAQAFHAAHLELIGEGDAWLTLAWGGEFGSHDFHGWDFPHFEIVGG